jgi:hypothetical protein
VRGLVSYIFAVGGWVAIFAFFVLRFDYRIQQSKRRA